MPSEGRRANEGSSPPSMKGSISARTDLDAALLVLRKRLGSFRPRWGIVLGSGLGAVASSLEQPRVIPMEEIPGIRSPAVAGHGGKVCCGKWGSESVLIFEGRPHLYEGCEVEETTRPMRIMQQLGVRGVILTNAAGSLDPGIPPGSLVRACDLIDLFMRRVRGDRPTAVAEAHPVLDAGLGKRIDAAARSLGVDLRWGILAGVLGPAYETASEVRLLRRAGADLVSMSTIPEAFVARRAGLRVAVVSFVTNHATGIGGLTRLEHEEVVARAAVGAIDLGRLLRGAVSAAT